jgi:Chaperone of endosialidase
MSRKRTLSILWVFACLAITLRGWAQDFAPASAIATNTVVPALIKYSGMLTGIQGKPATSTISATFSIYTDSEGGDPLWAETQNIEPDPSGHYTVALGSSTSTGLPVEVFASGEARWLGVRIAGQVEEPRVLWMSVPYALKAQDAATIGGLPPSAFLLANHSQGTDSEQTTSELAAATTNPDITGVGSAGFVPVSDSASDVIDSILFQNSSGYIGIGTTNPGDNLDVNGTTILRNELSLIPNTSKDLVLEVLGTNLAISNTGHMTFATGQTYLGAGTITGVTTGTGSGLSGGGSSAALPLSVNLALTTTCAAGQTLQWSGNAWVCAASIVGSVTAGTDLTGGGADGNITVNANTAVFPAFGASNTFATSQTINGNLTLPSTSSSKSGAVTIGLTPFLHNYGPSGSNNTFVGGAGNFTNSAVNLTGVGYGALAIDSSGFGNTAFGFDSLPNVTSGLYNSASGVYSGQTIDHSAVTGNNNTFLGAGSAMSTGTLTNATALGSNAVVAQSNAVVLGCLSGQNNCGGNVNVGVGTTTPAYSLDISGGDAIVRGPGNFQSYPESAFVYVGDTNHSVQAGWGYGIGLAPNGFSGDYPPYFSNELLIDDGGSVGIGYADPDRLLALCPAGGCPRLTNIQGIADGWNTYSSRRWKTNIHTLTGALGKVEQLRGVSYDLKGNGSREIGVIAEEVGAVVPEVVDWEANGKDARGVDYSRLTALLIEATKERQTLIRRQQSQIRAEQTQIEAEQTAAKVQQAEIARLTKQVTTIQAVLKQGGRTDSGVLTASAGTLPIRP